MQGDLKHFLLRALQFTALLIIIDLVGGQIARHLFFTQKTGKWYRITYTMDSVSAPIVVMGSSHANRHFDPGIIESMTGKEAYNAGVQGQFMPFIETLQEIMLNRYTPELILLNVDINWLYTTPDAYLRLSDLNPYYFKYPDEIRDAIRLKSRFEPYKNLSRLYQYNSTIVHILRYAIKPQYDDRGFRPLEGVLPENFRMPDIFPDRPLDDTISNLLLKFVERAKSNGVKVVFVVSPMVQNVDYENDASWLGILKIARETDTPLLNYLNDTEFTGKRELFKDYHHLNRKGAKLFTRNVMNDMLEKGLIKNL